jgi:hypothetical protein
MAKFFRYTISAFIIFTTLHVSGANSAPSQRKPYGSLDSILVKLEGDDYEIAKAKTTIQREEAINKFAKKANALIEKYTIGTTVVISDVKMKDENTATVSFNKIEHPMFDKIRKLSPFSLMPTWTINIPLQQNSARDIVPGQRLTLLGEASVVHYSNSMLFYLDQNVFIRLQYKNYTGGSILKFVPTAYKIENSTPTPRYIQPQKQFQPQTAAPGKIKSYKQQVTQKPIEMQTYKDKHICFKCPADWKTMAMHTNGFYKVTCTGGKEIFSVTYCYSKFDPIDTVNAWVNKCHIPEISRQAIYTSKVAGNSASSCYYYTKAGKFVHTGCVTVFDTKLGNTVIIHKQAESRNKMTSPTCALYKMEKSFKLIAANQSK